MQEETRQCQNCKTDFTIEPEDFDFYKKISVPPPTWCPECRMTRRMAWRNERALHHGVCGATKKSIITEYSPDISLTIYHRDYWWSDEWDQLASGRDYDFAKPLFVQFRELLATAPLPNLENTNVVDSEYGNHNADCKNCYLLFASFTNENVNFSDGVVNGKDSFDLYKVGHVEQSYSDILCDSINRVSFSQDVDESLNSQFLLSCKNVYDCIGCVNLRNKKYHIFNKPYGKEEYFQEMETLDLGSHKNITSLAQQFKEFSLLFPRRYASTVKSVDVTGDNIMHAKNCRYVFDIYGKVENSKFLAHGMDMRDSYDGYGVGGNAELLYEGVDSGINASRYNVTIYTHNCHDVQYTYTCHSSSHLFACIGLRNKQYCILNRQYTKEEYEALVPKIIAHMNDMPYVDAQGREHGYGEFFPPALSPFAYNETVAYEYFPLIKEESLRRGFGWKDMEVKKITPDVAYVDLPDHIDNIDDSIVGKIVECAHQGKCDEQCTSGFKVIKAELDFYKRTGLPLPHFCPNCRHTQRTKQRNPFNLWHRTCQCAGTHSQPTTNNKQQPDYQYQNTAAHTHGAEPCPTEFETSYAPERPEIVYCEQCYNAEVA